MCARRETQRDGESICVCMCKVRSERMEKDGYVSLCDIEENEKTVFAIGSNDVC